MAYWYGCFYVDVVGEIGGPTPPSTSQKSETVEWQAMERQSMIDSQLPSTECLPDRSTAP